MLHFRLKCTICCLFGLLLVKGQEFMPCDFVCQLEGQTPVAINVQLGANATVPCLGAVSVRGTPNILEWSFCRFHCNRKYAEWLWLARLNGQGTTYTTNPMKLNLKKNGELEVYNVYPVDEGIYMAKIKKDLKSPEFCFFILRVVRGPQIKIKSNIHVAFVEQNPVYLVCEADGYPVPTISWIKDGKVVQNSTSQTNFVIPYAEKSDAGLYTCLVSNPLGSDNTTVEVSIVADNAKTTLEPTVTFTEEEDEHNTVPSKDPITKRSTDNGMLHGGIGFASSIVIAVVIAIVIGIGIGFRFNAEIKIAWNSVRQVVCCRHQQRFECHLEDQSTVTSSCLNPVFAKGDYEGFSGAYTDKENGNEL